MKTLEELKVQMQNAPTLTDKIAIRIKMIEANRLSENPNRAINRPISSFLSNLHQKEQQQIRYRAI